MAIATDKCVCYRRDLSACFKPSFIISDIFLLYSFVKMSKKPFFFELNTMYMLIISRRIWFLPTRATMSLHLKFNGLLSMDMMPLTKICLTRHPHNDQYFYRNCWYIFFFEINMSFPYCEVVQRKWARLMTNNVCKIGIYFPTCARKGLRYVTSPNFVEDSSFVHFYKKIKIKKT